MDRDIIKQHLKTPEQETKERSQYFKDCGKKSYSEGAYKTSIQHFTDALFLDTSCHLTFANRSAAWLQLGDYANSLADAERSCALCPHYGKAWYRAGLALVQLGRLTRAVEFFKKALEIEPNHKQIRQALAAALEREEASDKSTDKCKVNVTVRHAGSKHTLQVLPDYSHLVEDISAILHLNAAQLTLICRGARLNSENTAALVRCGAVMQAIAPSEDRSLGCETKDVSLLVEHFRISECEAMALLKAASFDVVDAIRMYE